MGFGGDILGLFPLWKVSAAIVKFKWNCVPEHSSGRSIVSLETPLEAVADRKQFAFGDDTGLRLFRPTEASGGGFDAGDLVGEALEFQAVHEMVATR